MKKQIIGILLVFSLACGAGLLRLHDGQIQEEQADGSWKCVNSEIREIVNTTDSEIIEFADANDTIYFGYLVDSYRPGIDLISDEAIRSLCESGRVCEVMGHQISDYNQSESKCNLCGKDILILKGR